MSVNTTNPKTPLELVDACANRIEEMYLANSINDVVHFKKAYKDASKWAFELMQILLVLLQ